MKVGTLGIQARAQDFEKGGYKGLCKESHTLSNDHKHVAMNIIGHSIVITLLSSPLAPFLGK